MKKKIAAGALALATASTALLGSAGSADAASGVYNLRSGPSTQHRVIGKVYNPDCRLIMVDMWVSRGLPQKHEPGRGVWYYIPEHGGWVLNDGWCL